MDESGLVLLTCLPFLRYTIFSNLFEMHMPMIMMKIFTSDNIYAMCLKNARCFARHIVAFILINE